MTADNVTAQDEVVDICRDLIRIDTSNPGDHSGPGERQAAEYTAAKLAEVGLEPTVLESHPKRTSVVARIEGEDRTRPALLVHGHLDVVPANAEDWQVNPFSGEIADDCVWGRGAIDMKDMDAMMLAVVRQRLREQRKPARDVVLTFTADEEAGGTWGARFLVDKHPELFEGVTEAVGEVGGFSLTLGGQRLYLLQTAEKGMAWLRLTARGTAGHGSMVNPDNAVTELAEAIGRLGRHEWPVRLIPSVQAFLEGASSGTWHRICPERSWSIAQQNRFSLSHYRRNAAQHGKSDSFASRIQSECRAAGRDRGSRRALPARLRGGVPGRTRPGTRARRHPGVHPPRHRARDHPRR